MRNNGITILAEYSSLTDRTGVEGEGQLIIKDPQILNGGQTATTLAMMNEDSEIGVAAFESKEVLLKIIERPKGKSESELADFIESISDATNKQSKIVEADRRSNDPRMIQLQKHFYDEYGLFLERKRGEFRYGLDDKIVSKTEMIDRVTMARALTAYTGDPSRARSSENRIFEEEGFNKLLKDLDLSLAAKAFFALDRLEAFSSEGQSLRYAKYAILLAVSCLDQSGFDSSKPIRERALAMVVRVLSKWKEFESHVGKLPGNAHYQSAEGFNHDGYCKGSTVAEDI